MGHKNKSASLGNIFPIVSEPVADTIFKKPKVCQNDNPLVKTVSIFANLFTDGQKKKKYISRLLWKTYGFVALAHYGNTGYGVSSPGIQN